MRRHTGTHFDAPIHWISGRDLPNNSVDTIPAAALRRAGLRDRLLRAGEVDPDYLLTVEDIERFEAAHGRIPAVRGC